MTRDEAWALLNEYVANPALVRHCRAVEAAMAHYARLGDHPEEVWRLVGLLHDFDYERFPAPPDHTREGAKILRARGASEEVVGAILSHADWNLADYPRDTPLRRTLFAVDELCGFIYACALMRPQRIVDMQPASVKKKLKAPQFAAAVSREDIAEGARVLDLELDKHIANCIAGITAVAAELDLLPSPGT